MPPEPGQQTLRLATINLSAPPVRKARRRRYFVDGYQGRQYVQGQIILTPDKQFTGHLFPTANNPSTNTIYIYGEKANGHYIAYDADGNLYRLQLQ